MRRAVVVVDRVRTAVANPKAPMHPYHVRRFLRLTVSCAVLLGAIIATAAAVA